VDIVQGGEDLVHKPTIVDRFEGDIGVDHIAHRRITAFQHKIDFVEQVDVYNIHI
jgi:hypothetical protein